MWEGGGEGGTFQGVHRLGNRCEGISNTMNGGSKLLGAPILGPFQHPSPSPPPPHTHTCQCGSNIESTDSQPAVAFCAPLLPQPLIGRTEMSQEQVGTVERGAPEKRRRRRGEGSGQVQKSQGQGQGQGQGGRGMGGVLTPRNKVGRGVLITHSCAGLPIEWTCCSSSKVMPTPWCHNQQESSSAPTRIPCPPTPTHRPAAPAPPTPPAVPLSFEMMDPVCCV